MKVETDIIASSRNIASLNKDKLWYIDTSDNVCWDFQNWRIALLVMSYIVMGRMSHWMIIFMIIPHILITINRLIW